MLVDKEEEGPAISILVYAGGDDALYNITAASPALTKPNIL